MEFDNDLSILLKKAQELGIPSKFVEDGKNLVTQIEKLIPTGKMIFNVTQLAFNPKTFNTEIKLSAKKLKYLKKPRMPKLAIKLRAKSHRLCVLSLDRET